MSGYTVEVRTAILEEGHTIHTWLHITKPDGTGEAWGFYPKDITPGNIIYGDGEVRSEALDGEYSSSSGPISITEAEYNALIDYKINTEHQDYSIPLGQQCTTWAVSGLSEVGIIPVVFSQALDANPYMSGWLLTAIFNPLWQNSAFQIQESGTAFIDLMEQFGDSFEEGVNNTVTAFSEAIEYSKKEFDSYSQQLKVEAQQLINEAIETGNEWAEETWQDVIETIDKIEKAAIAFDELVQATAEEFVQAVENVVNSAREAIDKVEQLGDSVAGMVVKTYLELAKRADELGDEAGEWVDSSIEKLVRIANDFGDYLTEEGSNLVNDIKATISDLFNNAQSAILRCDPLTLDLDGA
jgi:hypothetical protein